MFRLLSRSQTKRAARPMRRASLGVEALEARYCLTGPSLTLTTQVLPNHMVQLSGVLTDNFFPGGVPVRFSGAVTGSTMTDWGGHYSFWTPNASLGSVSASAIDHMGVSSNTALGAVSAPSPSVSFGITYLTRGEVTLSGTVSDLDPGGRTVTFSGAASGTTQTNQDGSFSLNLKPSSTGAILAVVTDLWGSTATATALFNPDPPVVSDFSATPGVGNVWTFSGTVTAQEAEGMMVQLSGLASLQGQTAYVQADGSFAVVIQLALGEWGNSVAATTDWWGQQSNEATFMVS